MNNIDRQIDSLRQRIDFINFVQGSFLLYPDPEERKKFLLENLGKIADQIVRVTVTPYISCPLDDLKRVEKKLEKKEKRLENIALEERKKETATLEITLEERKKEAATLEITLEERKKEAAIAQLTLLNATEAIKKVSFQTATFKKFVVQQWLTGEPQYFFCGELTPGNELNALLQAFQKTWKDNRQFRLYGFRDAALSLTNRELISTNESLLKWLDEFFTVTNVSFRALPIEDPDKPSPETSPVMTNESVPQNVMSKLTSSKSVSSAVTRNSDKSYACKYFSGFICQFCGFAGTRETTQAAHFYEREHLNLIKSNLEDRDQRKAETRKLRIKELKLYGVSDWNADENLICLCQRCHHHFDDSRTIGIDPETRRLVISPSIYQEPLQVDKSLTYETLQGKEVIFPDPYFPPTELLKYRFNFYEDREKHRQESHMDQTKRKRNKRKLDQTVSVGDEASWKVLAIKPLMTPTEIETMLNIQKKITQENINKRTRVHREKIQQCGMEIYNSKGDGNCFLYAIIDQLKEVNYSGKYTAMQLRQRTLNNLWMILHGFSYVQLQDLLNESNVANIDAYVKRMAENGFYYSYPAMEALARDLDLRVRIFSADSFSSVPPTYAVIHEGGKTIVNVLYTGGNHYDSIRWKQG